MLALDYDYLLNVSYMNKEQMSETFKQIATL